MPPCLAWALCTSSQPLLIIARPSSCVVGVLVVVVVVASLLLAATTALAAPLCQSPKPLFVQAALDDHPLTLAWSSHGAQARSTPRSGLPSCAPLARAVLQVFVDERPHSCSVSVCLDCSLVSAPIEPMRIMDHITVLTEFLWRPASPERTFYRRRVSSRAADGSHDGCKSAGGLPFWERPQATRAIERDPSRHREGEAPAATRQSARFQAFGGGNATETDACSVRSCNTSR